MKIILGNLTVMYVVTTVCFIWYPYTALKPPQRVEQHERSVEHTNDIRAKNVKPVGEIDLTAIWDMIGMSSYKMEEKDSSLQNAKTVEYPIEIGVKDMEMIGGTKTKTIMDKIDKSSYKAAEMYSYFKFLNTALSQDDKVNIMNYFRVRQERVNPLDYSFIGTVRNACDPNNPPFLLIMCTSKQGNFLQRMIIRKTWGQMKELKDSNAKLVFIVGKSDLPIGDGIAKESDVYGDIVRTSVFDSYKNLTMKVMMALNWCSTYCPGVNFFMKADDDCFVHVRNAVNMLKQLDVPEQGVVVGNAIFKHVVFRTKTKWILSETEFPFNKMPLYTGGQTYIISGNIVSLLFYAGEHMPYVYIEDGFVAGNVTLHIIL